MTNRSWNLLWTCLLVLLSIVAVGASSKRLSVATDDPTKLMNEMISMYDPCAGSPVPAICRCALEFPPVTYDKKVAFSLTSSGKDYDIATGRTLMNFVRAIVVAAEPAPTTDGEIAVKLYANPPATPNGMMKLDQVVKQNPNFAKAELVAVMNLPRHLGGGPDRLFGAIWWLNERKSLIIAFRGTQTPFEWYLDGKVNSSRKINASIDSANGFGAAFDYCRRVIRDAVDKYDPMTLYVGGHSLGAAVAAITAIDQHMRLTRDEKCCRVYAMTFGQPRTFVPASTEIIDTELKDKGFTLWRVINEADPVPPSPPAAVTANGIKFEHTDSVVIYFDDASAQEGRDAAWNHHFYFDGYYEDNIPLIRSPAPS